VARAAELEAAQVAITAERKKAEDAARVLASQRKELLSIDNYHRKRLDSRADRIQAWVPVREKPRNSSKGECKRPKVSYGRRSSNSKLTPARPSQLAKA
jgi:hypothetical protein